MERHTEKKGSCRVLGFMGLLVAVVVLFAANLCMGSVEIPVKQVWQILRGVGGNGSLPEGGIAISEASYAIIWQIRLPRTIAAALLGGALALSGYLLQTFFQNPIAGPFVLGISSGAKLAVALTLVGILQMGLRSSSFLLIAAAFVGALFSMGFVLLFARKVYQSAMLIVSGVMIGYICSAVTDFVVTFADDSNIVNLHNWSLGSFSGITWDNVKVIAVLVLITFICIIFLSKPIAACQLGEAYAASIGVNLRLFRTALVFLASLLAAAVTAFAGPISFVGIAVPQLIRSMFRTTKPLIMIPACFLGGAVFCLFSDLIARTVFAPVELSISSVTALFGAPVVIWVMMHRRKTG
ncbi:MAG: iron ABC transporter permease [Lachnospiraceae bacterium]|nr:iron ABC transporter permease [Lachnospiraceae bacterium]